MAPPRAVEPIRGEGRAEATRHGPSAGPVELGNHGDAGHAVAVLPDVGCLAAATGGCGCGTQRARRSHLRADGARCQH
jgi:hypothetical protein